MFLYVALGEKGLDIPVLWCISDEAQRRQYEEWLGETQRLLQMQQRLLEEKMAAHRKTKKSLSAKQRTARKAGRELTEEDANTMRSVSEQQGALQKQLEQVENNCDSAETLTVTTLTVTQQKH